MIDPKGKYYVARYFTCTDNKTLWEVVSDPIDSEEEANGIRDQKNATIKKGDVYFVMHRNPDIDALSASEKYPDSTEISADHYHYCLRKYSITGKKELCKLLSRRIQRYYDALFFMEVEEETSPKRDNSDFFVVSIRKDAIFYL